MHRAAQVSGLKPLRSRSQKPSEAVLTRNSKSEFIRRFRRFTQIENRIFFLKTSPLSSYAGPTIFVMMVFICVNLRNLRIWTHSQMGAD
jgi:hypothetical protein